MFNLQGGILAFVNVPTRQLREALTHFSVITSERRTTGHTGDLKLCQEKKEKVNQLYYFGVNWFRTQSLKNLDLNYWSLVYIFLWGGGGIKCFLLSMINLSLIVYS